MSDYKNCPVCGFRMAGREKKTRSLNQNAYYWSCVIPILVENTGYFKEEVHKLLKGKFLSTEIAIDTKDGMETYKVVGDTKTLSTVAFESFLSDVRMWATLKLENCWIPTPNEGGYYGERMAE